MYLSERSEPASSFDTEHILRRIGPVWGTFTDNITFEESLVADELIILSIVETLIPHIVCFTRSQTGRTPSFKSPGKKPNQRQLFVKPQGELIESLVNFLPLSRHQITHCTPVVNNRSYHQKRTTHKVDDLGLIIVKWRGPLTKDLMGRPRPEPSETQG